MRPARGTTSQGNQKGERPDEEEEEEEQEEDKEGEEEKEEDEEERKQNLPNRSVRQEFCEAKTPAMEVGEGKR